MLSTVYNKVLLSIHAYKDFDHLHKIVSGVPNLAYLNTCLHITVCSLFDLALYIYWPFKLLKLV